tara:strand:+ start:1108 stop:1704 length:597 start_codon:yes stop_codon:yes gene_type:complete
MALITASEARGYVRTLTGTAEDPIIDTIIGRAGGLMAAFCGFPAESGAPTMESATYTHYLDGPSNPREIRLPVLPVTSVTSIYDDPLLDYGASTLVDSGDYTLYGDEGLVVLNNTASWSWNTARRAIKVTYVAGWSTAPNAVKHACALQAAHIFKHRDAIGSTSLSKAGGSANLSALGLLPEVRDALAPYRLTLSWVG